MHIALQQFNRHSHAVKAEPDADARLSEENKMKWTWHKQNANAKITRAAALDVSS